MKVRPKLFLIIFAITLAALLVLNALSYWQNTRDAEARLRDDLRREADQIARQITFTLIDREASLKVLAQTAALRVYLQSHPPKALIKEGAVAGKPLTDGPETDPVVALPAELGGIMTAFLIESREHYGSLACLNQAGEPLFHAVMNTSGSQVDERPSVNLITQNLPPGNSIGGNTHFIGARDGIPLRDLINHESFGPTLRYTVPVLGSEAGAVVGALVVDLKLSPLFKQLAGHQMGAPGATKTGSPASRVVIVLHQAGRIYYHSNETLSYQSVRDALPGFQPVAQAMRAEGAGTMFYETADRDRWLASYRSLGQMDLSLAVAANYQQELQPAKRSLMGGLLLSLPLAIAAALALTLIAQRRSGSLARLAQGAAAIARGELDQKLMVSSAENQPLADSMNALTMRLREQLARETESRQFDSFMRLSAMLTHDLKNAISSLSLLVTNMERQFDNAEFRADAMSSLKEATEKLQRLVTKLSEPVITMSGEHPRPRPTNLVPIIRRVLASVATSAPQSPDTEIDLPEELMALVDAERIEKVIENLVINALEAMGPGKGALKIAGAPTGQGRVSFSISDTGPGITRDFQERRLFHPFATTKQGGVGLGLYTCREVIRAHGGSIEVDSEPGVGTTFRVVLPSGKTGAQ
ncbi:MAG: ATP-binding protein [Pyrinomonadaceae bacterium]